MKFGSLFSGIGGLDLGLERAGMECVWQVEIDDYATKVLEKHWPNVPRWRDVTTFPPGPGRWECDLICGGFPCQPVSLAGKRKAKSDSRWLWPQFRRVLNSLRPRFAIIENVPGLTTAGLADVIFDLASIGYAAEWRVLSAEEFGAPHIRKRLFIVAYPHSIGIHLEQGWFAGSSGEGTLHVDGNGQVCEMADSNSQRLSRREECDESSQQPEQQTSSRNHACRLRDDVADADSHRRNGLESSDCGGKAVAGFEREAMQRSINGCTPGWWEAEPEVGRVANGVPSRVDRLRGLGNAVVPQVAEWIGRRIMNLKR